MVDMENLTLTTYAARCTKPGYKYDTNRFKIRIRNPTGITVSPNAVFISLSVDQKIITVSRLSDECQVLVDKLANPMYLAIEPITNVLYMSLANGIAAVSLSDFDNNVDIIVEAEGDGFGNFIDTSFRGVRDLLILDQHSILLSDTDNER